MWVHRVEITLLAHMYQYLRASDALLLIRYLFVLSSLLDVAAILNEFFPVSYDKCVYLELK